MAINRLQEPIFIGGIALSLRFILGRTGTGKTHNVMQEIIEKLKENPAGHPIIYLVPDQMTFQSEYQLINAPGLGGMIRAQVFSFTRLAWRVLQETGGISRIHLNSIGINMLLRKVIELRKNDLKVFGKAAEKSGFITQVEEMITEFKRYSLDSGTLEERSREAMESGQPILADKLADLRIIYDDLQMQLINKYIDSEDYLKLLAEKIPRSSFLKDAEIYVDGFHTLTPQELDVLGQLIQASRRVTVALTADKPFDEHLPHDLHLFRMTGTTYDKIRNKALEAGAEVEPCLILREAPRYISAPSLAHLEEHFDSRPTVPFQGPAAVSLIQGVNRRAEIEGAAREIKKLAREQGYRYRDIAILVRNASEYHDLIDKIFEDYEIPFFIDQKRSMLHHPVLELIRSSLDVITGNWRYEAVFRVVKTDLFYPVEQEPADFREEMDRLENFVLANGIQGGKWTQKEPWKYRRIRGLDDAEAAQTDKEMKQEEQLNRLRSMISEPIHRLQKRLKKAETGREMCEALYLYLEELDIPAKIEKLRIASEEAGKLGEAREHDQVWNSVIELLDQFVELLGDEKITARLFSDILETGMDTMRFSLVPPAIDQVLVASLDRSRLSNIKCTFILGANEGVIPAKPNEDGILSEKERESLEEAGVQLAPGGRVQLLDENFYIYLALSSPAEKLYVSYPMANDEGKALQPSVIIKRLEDLFPESKTRLAGIDPAEVSEKEQLDFIANPYVALSYLTSQLQAWKRNYPMNPLWWDVYNFYMRDGLWKEKGRNVLSSLFYRNETKNLSRKASLDLYGESLLGSVSRMETFRSCPFSHFASYGLKLKERKIYRLEAPDIGEMFHSALKLMSERLRERGIEWKNLTKSQVEQLSFEVVEQLAPKLQQEILLSSNRHHYIKHKLQKIITRASTVLSEHAKASGFAPIGLELGFGRGEALPPVELTLDNGTRMEIVGRIDRVDKAESSKGMLLRIIDYKSSQKTLNLSEVYYGLALQMLTYLDVVISHSKEWIGTPALPAGVLYFHVHDPLITANAMLSDDKLEDEIFKKFKMKGLLLGDEESVRLMDTTLESGRSAIVSAGFKSGGGFYSDSSIASEEEFGYLRKHARKTFKEIGTDITNGVVEVSPYKLKDKVPCTFCSFKAVCQFDQSLEENEYRMLKPEKSDKVLKKIREEAGINE